MQEDFLLGIVRMRGGALHMGKGRSNNAGKSDQISMIHLISLNKVNRQKRRRNKKELFMKRAPFRYIDVSTQQIVCSIK